MRRRSGRLMPLVLSIAILSSGRAPLSYAQNAGDPPPTAGELAREVQAMKKQLEELQKKTQQQAQTIQRLETQSTGAAPGGTGTATPPTAPGVTEAPDAKQLEEDVTAKVLKEVQPQLTAANKTFPSQFNPALGLIIDTVGSYSEHDQANFEFRAAELGLSAAVDPYVKGAAIITGAPDGFEVEEAYITTTSLPGGLTLKGGRFFADFGRLSSHHDHDLPFVNRPVVLDRFVQGESQGDGLELNWLTPLPQYLTLTFGAYNKVGAESARIDNTVPRSFEQFTYLARPATFFNLNDSNSLDLGASFAWTPELESYSDDDGDQFRGGKARSLAGIDLTYRYTPLAESTYHGLTWGSEFLWNSEQRNLGDTEEDGFARRNAYGAYSYVEAKLTRVLSPGFLIDWAQDLDRKQEATLAYSPYLTIWASEFQRIRLQYTYLDEPDRNDNEFFAQWTVVLGSHVHGFKDR